MPYTPFARFLAIALVVLCGTGLLWPDDRAYLWMFYALGAVPILLGAFTVSAVRSAPPFDDRSFHRGLPPGDGHAFFRVVWIHLLVLAGIALLVVTYCLTMNFGWRAMTWGVLMFTLPAWALCSALALAASNALSSQHWKSISWIAIFATPLFSWSLMYWIRQGIAPEDTHDRYRVQALHTIVLASGFLYPLCWWLAAVARRRGLSLAFGGATSALLPWLAIYGSFGKIEPHENMGISIPAGHSVSRKPVPASSTGWLPVGEVFEVAGLKEGQHMSFIPELRHGDPGGDRSFIRSGYVSEGRPPEQMKGSYFPLVASMRDGKVTWGEAPVWEEIRKQLPAHESFDPGESEEPLHEGQLSLRVPDEGDTVTAPPEEKRRRNESRQMTRSEFLLKDWETWVSHPGKWQLLTSCPADEGTSLRLPDGGELKVLPAELAANGSWEIPIKLYQESLWQSDGSWEHEERRRYHLPRVLFLDESGKHLYGARLADGNQQKVMLGEVSLKRYDAGKGERKDFKERNERLAKSRVFIFLHEDSEPFWTKQSLPMPK